MLNVNVDKNPATYGVEAPPTSALLRKIKGTKTEKCRRSYVAVKDARSRHGK